MRASCPVAGNMLWQHVRHRCNMKNISRYFSADLLQAVPENRRKVATLKGMVIAKKNRGWQSAFTIRNHLGNAGGIERTFPL